MGWWSADIMGGDPPLDWEDNIYGICGVEKFTGNRKHELTAGELLPHVNEIWDTILKDDYDPGIGYQVLAVLMLRAGAPITGELKQQMLEACDKDWWAKEGDPERIQAVTGLAKALLIYDGKTPIEIKSKGLFEVWAEKIEGK